MTEHKAFSVGSRIPVTEEKAGMYLCWDKGGGDVPPHALASKGTDEAFVPDIVYLRIDESRPTDIEIMCPEPDDGWWVVLLVGSDIRCVRMKQGKKMYQLAGGQFSVHHTWDKYEFIRPVPFADED